MYISTFFSYAENLNRVEELDTDKSTIKGLNASGKAYEIG